MNNTTKIVLGLAAVGVVIAVVYYMSDKSDEKDKKVTAEAKKSNKIMFTRE